MKYLISLLLLLSMFSCIHKNKMSIDFGTLNSNDVEIYLSIFPGFRNMPIYREGIYYDIPNEYGENDWIIIYKGQQQSKFRHIKTNRRNSHKYDLVFHEKLDTIFYDIDIKGGNSMKLSSYLAPIEEDKK